MAWARHYDAHDDMAFSVHRWREALDAARDSLPAIESIFDEHHASPLMHWTAEVRGLLGEFGGLIHRLMDNDVPDSLDTEKFRLCCRIVYARLNDLKRVPTSSRSDAIAREEDLKRIAAAYGALMKFLGPAASLASTARNPTPSGERAAGINYGKAMVEWINLQILLTPSVRAAARACYPAGAPSIRLGKLKPSPSVIETVADNLGVAFRNAVYQDRKHPLDGLVGESPREVRERLGVQTPIDGWMLFQADWQSLSPDGREFAFHMIKCSSIDFDELQVLAVREAECATRAVPRVAESSTGRSGGPQVNDSVKANTAEPDGGDDAAMLAPRDLAENLHVDQRALEKRLERWRLTNTGSSDFVEVADRTPRQPKFLYRLRIAKQVAMGMEQRESASHNPSHKRRTKRK